MGNLKVGNHSGADRLAHMTIAFFMVKVKKRQFGSFATHPLSSLKK